MVKMLLEKAKFQNLGFLLVLAGRLFRLLRVVEKLISFVGRRAGFRLLCIRIL